MKALIIAAGRGSRLHNLSPEKPKSLLEIKEQPLLNIILSQLMRAGIDHAIIVTGFNSEAIRESLGTGESVGVAVTYHHNREWEKKNGISVLSARSLLEDEKEFLLVMSDHLFQSSLVSRIVDAPLQQGETVLGVDRRIESVFDLDDATKVQTAGNKIVQIHKELPVYNGIDCGVFKCTPYLFETLGQCAAGGDCSLSDGCQVLAQEGKLIACEIGDDFWIDVDTPEAFRFADENFDKLTR